MNPGRHGRSDLESHSYEGSAWARTKYRLRSDGTRFPSSPRACCPIPQRRVPFQTVPPDALDRQGGAFAAGGQPALRGDVAGGRADGGARALRGGVLRAGRYGEPHQGTAAGAVRRSHLGADDAGPTSCACISPRSPTRCWSYCGAGACRARGWRGRNAARSA